MGILPKDYFDDLQILNQIRNDYSHSMTVDKEKHRNLMLNKIKNVDFNNPKKFPNVFLFTLICGKINLKLQNSPEMQPYWKKVGIEFPPTEL